MKTQKQIMGKTIVKLTLMAAMLVLSTAMATAQITVGGNVFGGGRKAPVSGGTNVTMQGGTVEHSVFGANDISGNVGGGTNVTITGEAHVEENVFGGANGYYGCNSDAYYQYTSDFVAEDGVNVYTGDDAIMNIPTVNATSVTINSASVRIDGSVYGGGNLAYVGLKSGSTAANFSPVNPGSVSLNLSAGHIAQNVFGGGNMASVFGSVNMTVNSANEDDLVIVGGVYGGNDKLGKVLASSGGDAKTASDGTSVPSDVCYVKIEGKPTIGAVYGGGNGDYLYDGTEGFVICGNESWLASNKPEQSGSFVDINTSGGHIDMAFAGGNSATVTGSATILLNAIGQKDATTANVGSIFGGNNNVTMASVPNIKLKKGVADEVYGGGNNGGISAYKSVDGHNVSTDIQLTSNEVVKIGTIYGGCKNADVVSGQNEVLAGTNIKLNSASATIGTIYGGCNVSGDVDGDSYITLAQGTVTTAVFGGANGDYGCNDGTNYTSKYDGVDFIVPNTTKLPTIKNTHVYVDQAQDKILTIGSVSVPANIYGGGNMAPVGSSLVPGTTEVKLVSGTVTGSAFGGGNMASVYGRANIYTPEESTITITNIYGGNDKSGSVTGAGYNGELALDGETELSATNAASYVKLEGSPTITNVYGGGNGDYTYPYEEASCEITSAPVQNSSFVDVYIKDQTIDAVPYKGKITNVYGGGNAAGVTDGATVILNEEGTSKIDNIYGGCKAANVKNTYVKLIKGVAGNVFGGNDVGGNVTEGHVDLVAAAVANVEADYIYGGGNGKYDYNTLGGSAPTSGSTQVQLTKGTVNHDVFGGGLAGNVDLAITKLGLENGTCDVVINGELYGAGCGNTDNIGSSNKSDCATTYARVGNTEEAQLYIYGLGSNINNVYGGGKAGDVGSATVEVKNTNTDPNKIGTLYGGCKASDLTGTTTIVLGDEMNTTSAYPKIDVVYGGNDYAGLTQNTNLTIHSGTYSHVYGAGNGVYDYYDDLKEEPFFGTCIDTVPYSMNVEVTFNGGTYTGHVYGGGNMGLVGDKNMTASTFPLGGSAEGNNNGNFSKYGFIHMTIHGGSFEDRVFAGACGTAIGNKRFFDINKPTQRNYTQDEIDAAKAIVNAQGYERGTDLNAELVATKTIEDKLYDGGGSTVLAYAYKQVDMDGGNIHFSLHGGSEGVDDGFPYECKSKDETTLRPSSIVNIVGGTIDKSLYGGGYEGTTYGSIYVHVGQTAIANSPVWTKEFKDVRTNVTPNYAWSFETDPRMYPFREASASLRKRNPLLLNASVYNGSDWGEGSGQYFDTPGFKGGEGLVYIDGLGYLTSESSVENIPVMEIANSVFGSGTSTSPADFNSRVWIKNYGTSTCHSTSRSLYSIQRTNHLLLENTGIELTGESDAFYAHTSNVRSLNRIDTVTFHQKNFIATDAPSEYLGMIVSDDNVHVTKADADQNSSLVASISDINGTLYAKGDLYDLVHDGATDGYNCNDENSYSDGICGLLSSAVLSKNVLLLNEGSYVTVRGYKDADGNHIMDDNADYGPVLGYLYVVAQESTLGTVTARLKANDGNNEHHPDDGGFVSPCDGSNYHDSEGNDFLDNERAYTNMTDDGGTTFQEHRSWKIGQPQGERTRKITIVAHAKSETVAENHNMGTLSEEHYSLTQGGETYTDYAYSTATLTLPPSEAGNYYVVTSVAIDDDNGGQLSLLDWGYDPTTGWWTPYQSSDATTQHDAHLQMDEDPNYSFGLMFNLGGTYFDCVQKKAESYPEGATEDEKAELDKAADKAAGDTRTVISGNNTLISADGFKSRPIINNASGVLPTLDFVLAYNTNLSTTIARDVNFVMMEKDASGKDVGPINVTVTISTIITDFDDMHPTVLAMYNEGESHEYVRKVVIPASFEERDLYITGIEWNYYSNPTVYYTQEEADRMNQEHQIRDASGKNPGDDGYTPTYPNDYDLITTETVKYLAVNYIDQFNMQAADANINTSNNHSAYNMFSLLMKPSNRVAENVSNTLGWYDIALDGRKDLWEIATQAKGSALTTTPTNEAKTLARKDFAEENWIKVGTLDGRSSAAIDMILQYNGNLMYEDIPELAHAKLYMTYINTKPNPDGSHTHNDFVIDTKLWTRTSGDTIYMAEPAKMTLHKDGSWHEYATYDATADVYGTSVAQEGTDGSTVLTTLYRFDNRDVSSYQKNDPVVYFGNFKQVFRKGVYQEGDVIAIMGPIHIDDPNGPMGLQGAEYSQVNIIRYAGSHFRWPGEAHTYRGPLVYVQNGAKFTVSNTKFNGSGVSRLAVPTSTTEPATAGEWISIVPEGDPMVPVAGTSVRKAKAGSYLVIQNGSNYEKYTIGKQNYMPDTTFVSAPVIQVEDKSDLRFNSNVTIYNNFNIANTNTGSYQLGTGTTNGHQYYHYLGGAIGIQSSQYTSSDISEKIRVGGTDENPIDKTYILSTLGDNNTVKFYSVPKNEDKLGSPTVVLGDLTNIYSNLVIDAGTPATSTVQSEYSYDKPGNYGGGIYVNGGSLTVGAKQNDNDIQICNNYYITDSRNASLLPSGSSLVPQSGLAESAANSVSTPTATAWFKVNKKVFKPNPTSNTFNVTFSYEPVLTPEKYHHSNVFLTRTKPIETTPTENSIQKDGKPTDCIQVSKQLASTSRIGVSKWFPGYKWRDKLASETEGVGRDTISIADYRVAGSQAADRNYRDGVWIDDSLYSGVHSTNASNYRSYNDYGDKVDLRYSSRLNYYKIYLHRCATFGKETPANCFAWQADQGTICPGDGDQMKLTLKGGVAPYTFKWYITPDNNSTVDWNTVSPVLTTSSDVTGNYTPTGLVLNPGIDEANYKVKIVATDASASEGCEVEHYVDLMLVQTGSGDAEGSPTRDPDKLYTSDHKLQSLPIENWLNNTNKTSDPKSFDVPSVSINKDPAGTDNAPQKVLRVYTYFTLDYDIVPASGAGVLSANSGSVTVEKNRTRLCPGDIITLNVENIPQTNDKDDYEVMMWSCDPTTRKSVNYVMTDQHDQKVTAYMAPNSYWYQTVKSKPVSGYVEDYHGNVTISTVDGLAWLISTVNGLNHQQHRTFIYDTITIKSGTYNMSAHKWTPLGNIRDAFRGTIVAEAGANISGIIVNEGELQNVGFFGQTDSARISGINLSDSRFKGYAYGGAMMGYAGPNTVVTGCKLTDNVISATNMVGALAAKSEGASIVGNTIGETDHTNILLGTALYAGGTVGQMVDYTFPAGDHLVADAVIPSSSSKADNDGDDTDPNEAPVVYTEGISNTGVAVDAKNLSALRVGGLFGYAESTTIPINQSKGSKNASTMPGMMVHNNYVHIESGDNSLYVGGLAGYASGVDLQNNYSYGHINSISTEGGLIGMVGENVRVANCYYEDNITDVAYGYGMPNDNGTITTFTGAGNNVNASERVNGIRNMTRILNSWVMGRDDNNYETWRSDLDGVNSGYPIFGKPDIVPVYDTVYEVVCDSMNLDGILITESGLYKTIYSKPEEFVDSILTIVLTVNHSDRVEYTDTIHYGEDYYGNGFSLTAEQISELSVGFAVGSVRVLQIVDSLLTEQGCDSLVVLNLLVCKNGDLGVDEQVRFDVKVYPNPTAGVVNVEADGLQSVEVYDALSRKVKEVKAVGDKVMFDLTSQAAGSYYLRIRTDHGVAIHKVIKN